MITNIPKPNDFNNFIINSDDNPEAFITKLLGNKTQILFPFRANHFIPAIRIMLDNMKIDSYMIEDIGYSIDSLVYKLLLDNKEYIIKLSYASLYIENSNVYNAYKNNEYYWLNDDKSVDCNVFKIKEFNNKYEELLTKYLFTIKKDSKNLNNIAIPINICNITFEIKNKTIDDNSKITINPSNFKRYNVYIYPRYSNDLNKLDLKSLNEIQKDDICNQIKKGIETLHKLDFAFGDLKPANICVDNIDNKLIVKLIDFGTINYLNDVDAKRKIINSFFYMSPIQAANSILNSNDLDEYEDKLINELKKYNIEEVLKECNSPIKHSHACFEEEPKNNDIFCLIMMIFYIYGNGYNFWTQTPIFYEKQELQVEKLAIQNIIEFTKNPDDYLIKSFNNVNIPIKYQIYIQNNIFKYFQK